MSILKDHYGYRNCDITGYMTLISTNCSQVVWLMGMLHWFCSELFIIQPSTRQSKYIGWDRRE